MAKYTTSFSLKTLVLSCALLSTCALFNSCYFDSEAAGTNLSLPGDEGVKNPPAGKIQNYWYAGGAEITSYKLTQARYGELHEGKAVLVFVTEPFSKSSWTKADNPTDQDVPVMKLNFTKKFNTGVYPYSMMTSTFLPVDKKHGESSIKISSSSQEWCGHTFMEMKNKPGAKYDLSLNSYFEGESFTSEVEKLPLEDDIWTMIRTRPADLPVGKVKMIPSFFYLRLGHQKAQGYDCQITIEIVDQSTQKYILNYPDLDRTLKIEHKRGFPYEIVSWEETYVSGWGKDKKKLTTKAKRINTIMSDYWNRHGNADSKLRERLGI